MNKIILVLMATIISLGASAQCQSKGCSKPETGKKVELRLIETTDVHGSFFPYDFIKRVPRKGSMARVCTYVDNTRKANPDGVILLDNGDILQGQPISYFSNYIDTTEENIAASVIDYMHYDAQTFGNHDVEPGHAVYDKWVNDVDCPTLGANILDAATGQPYVKPYEVFYRQGVKVAVLGLLTPAIPNWLAPRIWSGLRFDDCVKSAKYWVDFLKRNEEPDVVVVLVHSGREGGIKTDAYQENEAALIAKTVPGIDVVFYGHDHKRYNKTLTGADGKTVTLINPANNAMSVAQVNLSLEYDGNHWQVKQNQGELVSVVDTPINEEFVKHFTPYIDKVKAWVNQPIGTLTKDISSHDCFFGNSEFNDLILNLMLKLTKADIAFSAPLSPEAALKKGTITVADMFDLYKYENQLYTMSLTGAEIRKHLEMSYDQWVNTMTSSKDHFLRIKEVDGQWTFTTAPYNFDSAAGIDYEVDVTKPDGQKVHILRMSNGEPFDENKTYTVAINSYRANGGGELLTKGAGIPQSQLESRITYKSDLDQRHYLMEEIQREGTISPKPGTNWRFVPEKMVKPAAARDRKLIFCE